MSTKNRNFFGLLAGSALMVTIGVSGCAAGSSSDGATTEPSAPSARDATVKYAECMRENGIDMADPDSSGMIRLDGELQEQPGFAAAQEECGGILTEGAPGDGPMQITEEMRQQMLDLAKCMREAGIDFPDPDFSGGGATVDLGEGGIDPTDPRTREAAEKCQQEVGLPAPGGVQ